MHGGWHRVSGPDSNLVSDECCKIGDNCDIEDGETHAIQEGQTELNRRGTADRVIWLCVDNRTR